MNRYFVPTLEHIATVRIAGTICNNPTIRILILCSQTAFLETGNKIWQDLNQKALDFLALLELPEHLKMKIVNIIKPMASQMRFCISNTKHNLKIFDHSFHEFIKVFYWTSQGILNEKKIMADLLRCEELSIHIRYELACLYCFDDQIHNLWNQMTKCYRYIYETSDTQNYNVYQPNLITFWTYYVMGNINELIPDQENIWKYGLEAALHKRHDSAIRYFWEKISTGNREMCLPDIIPKLHSHTSTLTFLFSKLNENTLSNILHEYLNTNEYSNLLLNLLDFPYQCHFIDVIKQHWNIIPEKHWAVLLKRITEKMCDSKDYNYLEILRQFWSQSLIKNKRSLGSKKLMK